MIVRIATLSILACSLVLLAVTSHSQTAPSGPPAAVAPVPAPPDAPAAPVPPVAAPATPAASEPSPAAAPGETSPTAPAATAPASTPAAPATANTEPAPMPAAKPDGKIKSALKAARDLFSKASLPSLGKAVSIGYYPRGCLQGGVELPVDGPTWQVMRLSRNRNWGHPSLVQFLEKFAPAAAKATGWNGILVGDMAQPRGGPTPFGHMSHQTGLDVDIWFMPMPDRKLSTDEREKTSAPNMVADDWKHINPQMFTPAHIKFIKTAAEQPNVERVLVNAAIKKELCRVEKGNDKGWMAKVRPWYGHHDHIHVRLKCPADSPNCRAQPSVPGGDGCADKELAFWFSDKVLQPKKKIGQPPRPLSMADLPPACQSVLQAPSASLR